jgi:hypothetical protein
MPILWAYPQAVIPSPYPDALEFIWSTWRMQGVLDGDKSLYETKELFAPEGASLLLHTVCEGVLLPVTMLLKDVDPIWRFNCAVIIAFFLNGCAAISLLRALGAGPLVALLGALLIAFGPNQIGHLTAGHLNFLVLFPLFEICRLLSLVSRRGGDARIAWYDYARGSIAVAFMGRTNLYFLYYAVLISGCFSLWSLLGNRQQMRGLLTFWAAFLLGLTPNILHLYRIAVLALSKRYTPDHDPSATSADLIAYVVPSSLQRLGTLPELMQLRANVAFHEGETSLYVGVALLCAVVVACSAQRVRQMTEVILFLVLAAAAALASFGPWLTISGVPVIWNVFDYTLRALLPLYPSVPARFGLFVELFLVCAIVRALVKIDSRSRRAVVVCALSVALVELSPIRCNVTLLLPTSPALERLREDKSVSVVVDQSLIVQHAMLRQTVHGKALVGGFLSRRPRGQERDLRRNPFLRWVSGSGREYSLEQRRAGWSTLGADAVILDAAQVVRMKSDLQEIGLVLVDQDEALSIFKLERSM